MPQKETLSPKYQDEFSDEERGFKKLCGFTKNWCSRYCAWRAEPSGIWAVVGVLAFATLGWFWLGNFGILPLGDLPRIDNSKWQAVFLANGQVYFGHMKNHNREYILLKDIYYLQTPQPLQQGQPPANFQLVKLGNEPHGPEDAMFIPKKMILFWENLRTDSPMTQAIESTRK